MTSPSPLRWERQPNAHLWAYAGEARVAAVGRLDDGEYHWQAGVGPGFSGGSCGTEEEAQRAVEQALEGRE